MAMTPSCSPAATLRPPLSRQRLSSAASMLSLIASSLPLRMLCTPNMPSPLPLIIVSPSGPTANDEMKSSWLLTLITGAPVRTSHTLISPSSSPEMTQFSFKMCSAFTPEACASLMRATTEPVVRSVAAMSRWREALKMSRPPAANCTQRAESV